MKKNPHHLGIILDGNRRWAKEKRLPVFLGHRRGAEKVKELIGWCKNRGVKVLTIFIFSTENWNRTKTEVNCLMRLLGQKLNDKNMKDFQERKIKVQVIGQKEKLPKALQKKIREIEDLTRNNKGMILNFALSYGGRTEIVEAIKKIIGKRIPLEKINENIVSENLWTSDLDLIIRTGEEQRLSNFLIWQAAYSELYFCKKYWPDFTEEDLARAFEEYTARQRRFGK